MLPKNKFISRSRRYSTLLAGGLALVFVATACGVDETAHYPDKRFGRGADTETSDDSDVMPDTNVETPNQTLLHQQFLGYFDLNSVKTIYYGEDPHNGHISEGGGLIDSAISTALSFMVSGDTTESLEMLVKQQSKDVKSVTQTVQTDGGDALSKFKGDEPQSGSQYLEWAANSSESSSDDVTPCPKPFVCIKRMVWVPKSGKTFTYCYRDHATKKPMAIPYSANSNFTKQAYEAAIGDGYVSRPIDVTSHPGDVSCDDPEKVTQDVNQVSYALSLGKLENSASEEFLRRAKNKSLKADTEVVIEYRLHDMTRNAPYVPKKGPYIDQLTRLNSKIKFFANTEEHVVVKIERTVTSPFRFGTSSTAQFLRDAYGQSVGDGFVYMMGRENDIEGIQLNYSFEFCTHLSVVKNPFNHCAGNSTP